MKITSINNNIVPFCAEQKHSQEKNPVSTLGEREVLLKGTVLAGLGVGGRALWLLVEEGFIFEDLFNVGTKFVDKNKKHVTGGKKQLLYFGAWAAVTAGFVGAVAALYTLYKTPEILYKGKVNSFVKGKDMDVYIKGNKVEKELYDQMNDKAIEATPEEKEVLSQQYLKLKAAKNQVPESINQSI